MTADSSNGRSFSHSAKFQGDGLIKTLDGSAINTFKLLKNINLENGHDDKIMTYSEFTELVLAKLRKWGKSSGKQDEASHASREIHKKCKLLFKQV